MDAIQSPFAAQGAMLAEPHKRVADAVDDALTALVGTGEWWFDLKWDGVRCLALVNPPAPQGTTCNGVALVNRNGVDITYRYPDVCAALSEHFGEQSAVLDGEVVAFGPDGKPAFDRLAKRDRVGSAERALSAARNVPCTFVAFDLLSFDGRDERQSAWIARRVILESTFTKGTMGLMLSPASEAGDVMWSFIREQGLEGLIAKRVSSHYQAGRSPAWIKLKPTTVVTCIVTGWEPGKGKNTGVMGALHLSMVDQQGVFVPVGKVGTGFSDEEREVWASFFADDAADHASVLVDVEYQNRTKDGKMRFPSYKGVRQDVGLLDASTQQEGWA